MVHSEPLVCSWAKEKEKNISFDACLGLVKYARYFIYSFS
jgi:hypothetical protein